MGNKRSNEQVTDEKVLSSENGNQPGQVDPIFEKYSRKSSSERVYSTAIGTQSSDNGILNRVGNVTSGLAPYTGQWTTWEAAHLMRRLCTGVRLNQLNSLLSLTPSAAVNSLLTAPVPALPSATPLNYYQSTLADSGGVPYGANWTTNNLSYQLGPEIGVNYFRELSHSSWRWGVYFDDAPNIREKMVMFWYHFIPINFDDVKNTEDNSAMLAYHFLDLFRIHALGNFKQLVMAVTKNPAMLVYLGNQYSTAQVPNENYARELMELFTMGKLPVQNYTEQDVVAAAKVLSGWKVENFNASYPLNVLFDPASHNQTNKTFSSNFGSTTITNQTGVAGANEFDVFFNMLFTQQAVTIAKYVCRRLYRFFVYYDIDTNIENNIITPLSSLLISSNWEMAPVISTLFKSEHFFDMANRGVMIKSPADYISNMVKNINLNTSVPAGPTQLEEQYGLWNYFAAFTYDNLEQSIGYVPNVSGWKAYYQPPSYYQYWINSNTIQKRMLFFTEIMNNVFISANTVLKVDVIQFAQQFPNSTVLQPDQFINAIMPLFFSVDLEPAFKQQLKTQTLLNGQATNAYWTSAWSAYMADPTDPSKLNIVTERLTALLTSIVQLAEYQLM